LFRGCLLRIVVADVATELRRGKPKRAGAVESHLPKSAEGKAPGRYMIPTTMDTRDPAGEFLRITERYRRMSDGELLVLMPQSSELTPFAQQALANEVRSRGLKAEVEDEKPSAASQFRAPQYKVPPFKAPPAFYDESPELGVSVGHDFPDADSSDDPDSYQEDRKLVELCTVWSVRDALKVQTILDGLAIPFFMGLEKATGVDEVTSNFANGVGVQIMQIGLPWAGPAMRHYEPEDDPTPKEEVVDELPVRCPQCHSTEVVFEGLTSEPAIAESSQKYKWTCDSCGYQWEDDGVAKED
jgi:DNA-directed RNA polymerase subunit M/transcription elongation factor TFIIS